MHTTGLCDKHEMERRTFLDRGEQKVGDCPECWNSDEAFGFESRFSHDEEPAGYKCVMCGYIVTLEGLENDD